MSPFPKILRPPIRTVVRRLADVKTPGPTDPPPQSTQSWWTEYLPGFSYFSAAPAPDPKTRKTKSLRARHMTSQDLLNKTKSLVQAIRLANDQSSKLLRCEKLSSHLLDNLDAAAYAVDAGAIAILLNEQRRTKDDALKTSADRVLSQLGHAKRPAGRGIRILSLDGGGSKGLVILEVLAEIERRSGKKISELFDYVIGVSTGAIIVGLLIVADIPINEAKKIYENLAVKIFDQGSLFGIANIANLVRKHSYYDTDGFVAYLKEYLGEEKTMLDVTGPGRPKMAFVSAVVNQPTIEVFLFRNYCLPPHRPSVFRGLHGQKIWTAALASGSAPLYFEECIMEPYTLQDGGILVNNPTGVGIHEAKLIWPKTHIQAVVSVGSGRILPRRDAEPTTAEYTDTQGKLLKIIDSASDTQLVHFLCHDVLDKGVYFRFNPYLPETYYLNENRIDYLKKMQDAASLYCRKNGLKFSQVVARLTEPKGVFRTSADLVTDRIHRMESLHNFRNWPLLNSFWRWWRATR